MRAVGIIRVSVVGGRDNILSPETQRTQIKRAAEQQGWDLAEDDIFEELDVSGGKPLEQRPGLSKAVTMLEEGNAQVIVAGYFDRLFRSLKTQGEVLARAEAAGGTVFAVDMGQVSNKTSGEFLKASMFGAFAEYYRRLIAEKVSESMERAVMKRGAAPMMAPYGYTHGPDKVLRVVPEEAAILRECFRLRAAGARVEDVRDYLASQGVQRTFGGVGNLLKNRIYLGEVNHGQWSNPNAHEPIIDHDLFAKVQRLRISRGRQPEQTRLLSRLGILRCGSCDGALTIHNKAGGPRGLPSYKCSDQNRACERRVGIVCDYVDEEVVSTVKRILADVEARTSVTDAAHDATSQLQAAQEALDSAVAGFGAAGLLTEPSAIERLTQLREKRDAAQAEVDQIGSGEEITVSVADWELLTRDEQRALIRASIERVVIDPAPAGKGSGGDPRARIRIFPRG